MGKQKLVHINSGQASMNGANLSTAKALWAFERGCAIESQAGQSVRIAANVGVRGGFLNTFLRQKKVL